jgi:peptidoglycan/LPS O-acetylase OafA/YrhL
VLLVIARHTYVGGFAGSYVGVDIFFVRSGFLITAVLVEEWDRRQRIGLGRFYLRRILRLYPALVVAVTGSIVIAELFFGPYTRPNVVGAIPPAHLLDELVGDRQTPQSARTSVVLERRGAVLPRVASTAHRRVAFREKAALLATVAPTAAFVVGVAILSSGWSADRIYLGTDARAPQLLLGTIAALAISIRRPTHIASLVRIAALAGALFLIPAVAGAYGHNEADVLHVPLPRLRRRLKQTNVA